MMQYLPTRSVSYAHKTPVGWLLVGFLVAWPFAADATQLDLRLEVDFAGASPSAGGNWQLFAKSDEQGVFALGVTLSQIDAALQFHLPSGTVNGADPAGFANLINDPAAGGRRLFATQQVLPQTATEQGLFYGVGTVASGSPGTIGPTIASLTSPQNIPWATSDPLWSTGFSVASGTFSPGQTPGIVTSASSPQALLFETIGSTNISGFVRNATSFTTLVQTNLSLGTDMGDYNADGTVDAADYTLWRDTQNISVTAGTGADGSGNGVIDAPDYAVWVSNYGLTATSAASGQSVPEPTTCLLLLLAIQLFPSPFKARG